MNEWGSGNYYKLIISIFGFQSKNGCILEEKNNNFNITGCYLSFLKSDCIK